MRCSDESLGVGVGAVRAWSEEEPVVQRAEAAGRISGCVSSGRTQVESSACGLTWPRTSSRPLWAASPVGPER